MDQLSVLQRKEAVVSALNGNPKITDYTVKVTPINGSGDMEIELKRINKYKERQMLQGVIPYDKDLTHLKEILFTH
ncbi:MAG: hypothetical protein WC961_07155 [Anaerovoracaceae bacterium]